MNEFRQAEQRFACLFILKGGLFASNPPFPADGTAYELAKNRDGKTFSVRENLSDFEKVLSEKVFGRNEFQIGHFAFDNLEIVNVVSDDK